MWRHLSSSIIEFGVGLWCAVASGDTFIRLPPNGVLFVEICGNPKSEYRYLVNEIAHWMNELNTTTMDGWMDGRLEWQIKTCVFYVFFSATVSFDSETMILIAFCLSLCYCCGSRSCTCFPSSVSNGFGCVWITEKIDKVAHIRHT